MSVEPDFAAATRDCAGGMRVLTEVDPHHDHTVALGCQIRLLVLGRGPWGLGRSFIIKTVSLGRFEGTVRSFHSSHSLIIIPFSNFRRSRRASRQSSGCTPHSLPRSQRLLLQRQPSVKLPPLQRVSRSKRVLNCCHDGCESESVLLMSIFSVPPSSNML